MGDSGEEMEREWGIVGTKRRDSGDIGKGWIYTED